MTILAKSLICFFTLSFGLSLTLQAQNNTELDDLISKERLTKICYFKNPSFEDDQFTVDGKLSEWNDCGLPRYTPPTVHEDGKTIFKVQHKASEGKNFISMVVRDDESWELISQELSTSLSPLNEYIFKLDVAFSESMTSPTTKSILNPASFDNPIILRIYGGQSSCDKNNIQIRVLLKHFFGNGALPGYNVWVIKWRDHGIAMQRS